MSEQGDRSAVTGAVGWVGDSASASRVEALAGVETTAVEGPADLRDLQGAVACVVVGEPPGGLGESLAAASVPVIAYVDADPAEVPTVADDFVRRTGDGDAVRLADRLAWHAARRDVESATGGNGDPVDGGTPGAGDSNAGGSPGSGDTGPTADDVGSTGQDDDRRKVAQLHDIATELLDRDDAEAVYDLVVDAAERVLEFDICSVDAVDDGRFVPKAVSEGLPEDGYEPAPVSEGGLAGEAHRTGETLVVDDVRECRTADPATDEYRSILTVPIGDVAVFQAGSTAVGAFDDADRDLAELLAAHAAGSLHRIRSAAVLRERRETIERLHDAVARMVACERETELYDLLVAAAEEELDFSVCIVLTAEPDRDVLAVRAASDVSLAPAVGTEAPADGGLYGRTYREGTAYKVDDVARSDVADPHDERYASAVSVPLGDAGVVQAISTEPNAFDDHDLEMAELLASQAGAVLTRLRAEQRLRAERDRLRALFEHVPDPAVSFAFEGSEPIVRDVNPAFEETFGYDAGTIAGENVDEYIVPEDGHETAATLNELLRAGEALHHEVRRVPADGDPRDFIVHVVPTAAAGGVTGYAIYTDITDRKRRERRLDALNETTRELLGATDAEAVCEIAVSASRTILDLPMTGVFRRDGDQLVLAAASAAAWELFDGPPPQFGSDDAVWGAFQAGEPRLVTDVDTGGFVDDAPIEAAMVVPLGDHGVLASAGPGLTTFDEETRDLAGVLAASVEAALDRAERERRLRDRERELQRQNDRLEEFASVVSHDLRTPLSVARGHLDLAQEAHDSEALRKVADAHDRMDDLIEDLLALAREGRVVGDAEPVAVADAAREAWGPVSGTDATLQLRDPGTVEADRDRLCQLLANLFRNAVEHAPPEVTVTVGALGGESRQAGFFVADDGPGIPEDRRERVFDRGFTTADDGTGFGLAIVREIAQAHGWSVGVTDSDSGGARFEIRTR